MNLFGDNEPKDNGLSVLFDIRSGSVGVAVVNTNKQNPDVLWANRFRTDFLAEHDSDRLLHLTRESLSRAVESVQQEALPSLTNGSGADNISGVQCFFAAPWQVGNPQDITITKDSEFTVNESRLELAEKKAQTLFLDNAVSDLDTQKEDLQPLTTARLAVWCNGYRLDNPEEVETKRLRVLSYVSMLPRRVKRIAESEIEKRLRPGRLNLHSFTAAVQQVFTHTFSHPKSFLVIDVDEELTQLLIINEGALMGSVTYPLGSHFLVRAIAEAAKVPAADARTKLREYQSDEQTVQLDDQTKQIIREARERWQNSLASSLAEFSADISIPKYAFILANQETTASFTDFAQDVDVEDHIITQSNLQVHPITEDSLSSHLTADHEGDRFLSIAAMTSSHAHTNWGTNQS